MQDDVTHLSTTPGGVSAVESEEDLTVPPPWDPEAVYFRPAGLGLGFFGVVLKRPLNLYNKYRTSRTGLRNWLNFLKVCKITL